jgi:hypothetical protein
LGLGERARRVRARRRGDAAVGWGEVGHLPAQQYGGLKRVADRGPSVDEELVDVGDGGVHELVILRRRRRDLRFSGEHDEPDAEIVGRLVEERPQRLLGGAEARGLDILRLHRARGVDDEDDRRTLGEQRPLHLRAREPHKQDGEAERDETGWDVPQPRAAGHDGREHFEVRVANRVARATAVGEDPQSNRDGENDETEKQPGALERHPDLVQSAWTWTNARTPASSASPLTRTLTLLLPTVLEPDTLETRLALGGVRVSNANACSPPTRRSPDTHRRTTVVAPGRTRTVFVRRVIGWLGRNAATEATDVGTREPPPAAGMQPMNGLNVGARSRWPT